MANILVDRYVLRNAVECSLKGFTEGLSPSFLGLSFDSSDNTIYYVCQWKSPGPIYGGKILLKSINLRHKGIDLDSLANEIALEILFCPVT
jgi:hypothetical protein